MLTLVVVPRSTSVIAMFMAGADEVKDIRTVDLVVEFYKEREGRERDRSMAGVNHLLRSLIGDCAPTHDQEHAIFVPKPQALP